jgi:hypothetical protein
MRTYYLDGRRTVRDKQGSEFSTPLKAIEHSKELAKRIRHERPKILDDLYITVIDESGTEIHREPVLPRSA